MKAPAIALGLLMALPLTANAAEKKAPSTADFVKTVAISDKFEIEAGKLAQEKGPDAQKKFAAMMVQDHSKTSSELQSLITDGKVKADLPTALDKAHGAKLDQLKKANGRDFAQTYRASQVKAHKDAVTLFERYASTGDNADLKAWAAKTLPALKHHGEMASKL